MRKGQRRQQPPFLHLQFHPLRHALRRADNQYQMRAPLVHQLLQMPGQFLRSKLLTLNMQSNNISPPLQPVRQAIRVLPFADRMQFQVHVPGKPF